MSEANGFDLDPPMFITFSTRALVPPELAIADRGIDDFTGDGQIEPREIVEITTRIQNRGQGVARSVTAEVHSGDEKNVSVIRDPKTKFILGNLQAGEYKDIVFSVFTNTKAMGVPIRIALKEARGRFDKTLPLDLPFYKPQKKAIELFVKGKIKPPIDIPDVDTLSVDVDKDIPRGRQTLRNGVAVVIGNQNYNYMSNVEYAKRDALVMYNYLKRTFGYEPDNIFYCENATKAQFESLFGSNTNHKGWLYRSTRKSSEVFIYYSGHGHSEGPDKPSYFVPCDAEVASIGLTGYALDVFYRNMNKLIEERQPKRLIVVIESCFSGYLAEHISSTRWTVDNPLLALKDRGAIVMTAASGSETAKWYEARRHGLFTYFLLKAFQNSPNKADQCADKNGDRKLTLAELQSFILDPNYGVPYWAGRLYYDDQKPVIIGNEDTILIEW